MKPVLLEEDVPAMRTFDSMDTPACLLSLIKEAKGLSKKKRRILEAYRGKCGCTCLCPGT